MLAGEALSAGNAPAAISAQPHSPIYPLKASPNNRYLVDKDNVPFMMVGGSPQSLLGRMSKSDAAYLYSQPPTVWDQHTTWADPTDDAVALAVAKGVRSADPNHIHTTELNYPTSGSLDDARWEPLVELDGAYTYYPTYAQVLKE